MPCLPRWHLFFFVSVSEAARVISATYKQPDTTVFVWSSTRFGPFPRHQLLQCCQRTAPFLAGSPGGEDGSGAPRAAGGEDAQAGRGISAMRLSLPLCASRDNTGPSSSRPGPRK